MPGATLQLRDLRHDLRPGETLLQLAALTLPPGRLTVLNGPSGSGKSTLLYLLSGLLLPSGGALHWDGVDLAQATEGARDRWRRQKAGFVFQDFHLIPELTPLDNVLAPVWFSTLRAGRHRARAQDLLGRFGVPARRRVALLSRGEQQRVALSRALIRDPAVIFADEPTASLDTAAGRAVAAHLRDLAHLEGRNVIVVSHDPDLIAMADTTLRLERGTEVQIL